MDESPVHLFLRVMYNTADTFTGFFGLTPLQVVEIAGAIVLVLTVVSIVRGLTGRTKFSLDDDG